MYTLRQYQREAKEAILHEWDSGHQKTLLVLPTGCHGKGQCLLLADGSVKSVEEIHVGDRLLGADGNPRTVLHEQSGIAQLYRVTPVKGKPFVVTGDHRLTLVRTNEGGNSLSSRRDGEIIDVPVLDYLTWPKSRQHLYKLFRSDAIQKFPDAPQPSACRIDPYFLGLLLGDGTISRTTAITTMDAEVADAVYAMAARHHMNVRVEPAGQANTYHMAGNRSTCGRNWLIDELRHMGLYGCRAEQKFVPPVYLHGDLNTRLQVLAGLLDTDGHYTSRCYDFISASRHLAGDLAFLCRSAGLAAYVTECTKRCQNGYTGTYFRVSISGSCDRIPCRVAHKKAGPRLQKKSVLRTGFFVEPIGPGPYYGFTVDGDNHYLLDDFTVTHNCGKTVVFASVAENQVDSGHRVLIMAHREELLSQASDKLYVAAGLESVLEKAQSTSLNSVAPVTLGSVQSMSQEKRLQKFPKDYFQDIIVDEAHHCLSASYQRVLRHFNRANVLGVTATPDRGDMKNLGEYFDTKAYEYSMAQAIEEGYLCPIRAQMIPLKLDIGKVRLSKGDFNAGDVGNALEPYLKEIAREMTRYCNGRKTVVFLPLVATSQKFCKILNNMGLKAAEVNGNTVNRAEILKDFEKGKYDVLCNSMLLTEGWDCPAVDCIVILRPTKVRSLYQQMVGRGMRTAEGKENLLLLDFLWLCLKHDLCRPSALISRDEDVAKKVNARLEEYSEGIDLVDAEKKAERDVLEERESALAHELATKRNRKRKLVDPLIYSLSINAEDLVNYEPSFAWEMAPASDNQLNVLEKFGIFGDAVPNAGMASKLIDRVESRKTMGLATPKQIRCLEKYGFRKVGTWKNDDAKNMIARISKNNWRVPYGLNPKLYQP